MFRHMRSCRFVEIRMASSIFAQVYFVQEVAQKWIPLGFPPLLATHFFRRYDSPLSREATSVCTHSPGELWDSRRRIGGASSDIFCAATGRGRTGRRLQDPRSEEHT